MIGLNWTAPPPCDLRVEGYSRGAWLHVPNELGDGSISYYVPGHLRDISAPNCSVEDDWIGKISTEARSNSRLWWLSDFAHRSVPCDDTELANLSGATFEKAFAFLENRPLDANALAITHSLLSGGYATPTPFREGIYWLGRTLNENLIVPPPTSAIDTLIADYCLFLNRTDIAFFLKLSLTFLQLVQIHPFHDGNGRLSRLLAATLLKARTLNADIAMIFTALLALKKDILFEEQLRISKNESRIEVYASMIREIVLWSVLVSRSVASATTEDAVEFSKLFRGSQTTNSLFSAIRDFPLTSYSLLQRKLNCSAKLARLYLNTLADNGWAYLRPDSEFLIVRTIDLRRRVLNRMEEFEFSPARSTP